eukprot:1945927-Amphidinium_carterae.2
MSLCMTYQHSSVRSCPSLIGYRIEERTALVEPNHSKSATTQLIMFMLHCTSPSAGSIEIQSTSCNLQVMPSVALTPWLCVAAGLRL